MLGTLAVAALLTVSVNHTPVLAASTPDDTPSDTAPSTPGTSTEPTAHRVVVVLSEQRAYVYARNGELVGRWPISSGSPAHPTPPGAYRVTTRTRTGTARSNPNVHMDWFTRFNGGIGFHGIPWIGRRDRRLATPLGRQAVSHGCIRMADHHARRLYRELPERARILVVDTPRPSPDG